MCRDPVIDLGYRCRDQFAPFHMRKERWACVVAHRRAGKTVGNIMDLVDDALRCSLPNGRFAYIAPYYAQAKDVAWTYLKQFVGVIPGIQEYAEEFASEAAAGEEGYLVDKGLIPLDEDAFAENAEKISDLTPLDGTALK